MSFKYDNPPAGYTYNPSDEFTPLSGVQQAESSFDSTPYGNQSTRLDDLSASNTNKILDFKKDELAFNKDQAGFNNTMAKWNAGIKFGTDLLNTWTAFKQLGLQEKQFKFNKSMATKQFNLAKESYDRKKKRSQGIADFYGSK